MGAAKGLAKNTVPGYLPGSPDRLAPPHPGYSRPDHFSRPVRAPNPQDTIGDESTPAASWPPAPAEAPLGYRHQATGMPLRRRPMTPDVTATGLHASANARPRPTSTHHRRHASRYRFTWTRRTCPTPPQSAPAAGKPAAYPQSITDLLARPLRQSRCFRPRRRAAETSDMRPPMGPGPRRSARRHRQPTSASGTSRSPWSGRHLLRRRPPCKRSHDTIGP